MGFFVWNDSFGTGIPAMDEQHRKFFDCLNELQVAAGGGKSREALQRLFGDLSDYVARHFAAEDRLLSQTGYPEVSVQRKQHVFFAAQIAELKSRYESGDALVPESALEFLRDWFLKHILEEDKKYAAIVAEKTER